MINLKKFCTVAVGALMLTTTVATFADDFEPTAFVIDNFVAAKSVAQVNGQWTTPVNPWATDAIPWQNVQGLCGSGNKLCSADIYVIKGGRFKYVGEILVGMNSGRVHVLDQEKGYHINVSSVAHVQLTYLGN